jgi:hypothetical protein
MLSIEYEVGDKVIDDLTGDEVVVVSVLVDPHGSTKGYITTSGWLSGRRFAWELSPLDQGK